MPVIFSAPRWPCHTCNLARTHARSVSGTQQVRRIPEINECVENKLHVSPQPGARACVLTSLRESRLKEKTSTHPPDAAGAIHLAGGTTTCISARTVHQPTFHRRHDVAQVASNRTGTTYVIGVSIDIIRIARSTVLE